MKLNWEVVECTTITLRTEEEPTQDKGERWPAFPTKVQNDLQGAVGYAGDGKQSEVPPEIWQEFGIAQGDLVRVIVRQKMQDQIAEVITRHLNAFTWTSTDMPGINPDFLCHRLTMDEKVRPVIQRRRKFNEEIRMVIKEETHKLLRAAT